MKYLDQQTGCVAQVSWSKYTTPNLQVIMIHSYISTLSCNQMVSTTKFKVRKFDFARMDFSFLKNNGGDEMRLGYVRYIQGIQHNVPACRDSGNNFGRFSVSFFECWISYLNLRF